MNARLHNIDAIPEGKTVGDILPTFAGIKGEIRVGEPNEECAACRKPFSVVRKPRNVIKLYPQFAPIPFAFSYRICGACNAMHQRGGLERESFLAAVEAYHLGTSMEGLS